MPKSRIRKKPKMPVGRAAAVATKRGSDIVDVVIVARVSPRCFRWNIIDPKWRAPKGRAVARTGTATTHRMAEKQAEQAWKAGQR